MKSFLMPPRLTPEQARQRSQSARLQLAGNMPTDMGSGMQAVANALMTRHAEQQAMFPAAPGGGRTSPMQGLKNMFRLGGGMF